MPELLPCPFCGGKPEPSNIQGYPTIECPTCNLSINAYDTMEEAVVWWNWRSVSPPVAAIVFMWRDDGEYIHAHGFEEDGDGAAAMFDSPDGRELVHLKSWTFHPRKSD